MRFLFIFFILLGSIHGSIDDYRGISATSYSGHINGYKSKKYVYMLPAGYNMKINYRSRAQFSGKQTVRFRHSKNMMIQITNDPLDFYEETSSGNSYTFAGSCDRVVPFYMELKGLTSDSMNSFDYNMQLYNMTNCNNNNSSKDSLEDLIIDKKYDKYKKNGTLAKNEFVKYKLRGYHSRPVNIRLYDLTADLDLYVKHNGVVDKTKYDCRPWFSRRKPEECHINFKNDGSLYTVGVRGYNAGSFKLEVSYENIKDISVNDVDNDYIELKSWKYYKIKGHKAGQNLVAQLRNLSNDIDLYVKKGSKPTVSSYECRSWKSGRANEECKISVTKDSEAIYIGVRGYAAGSYELSLDKDIKVATLLLHGLASSSSTWDKLVSEKYNGTCNLIDSLGILKTTKKISYPFSNGYRDLQIHLQPFSGSNYCFRLDFGKYDRTSNLKDLNGRICSRRAGCRGDYSTFSTLGLEVSDVVSKIKSALGDDTEVVLVGHSRGGLAATAFLGGDHPNRDIAKAFLSTGTPFTGSPLGGIYKHMKTHCMPYHLKKSQGYCRQDWEAREFLKDQGGVDQGLDIIVPSVGFLQSGSQELKNIYKEDRLKRLQQGKRYYKNLVYKDVTLGYLGKKFGITYNPFPTIRGGVDTIIGKNFSRMAEEAILGTNAQTKAREYSGDGIVPYNNQDMSHISTTVHAKRILVQDGRFIDTVYSNRTVNFNQSNRKVAYFNKNVYHTDEPNQVDDISSELDTIWSKIVTQEIPSLTSIIRNLGGYNWYY